MDTLLQDLRYAARRLFKSPGFTLVAVLTLALGIGATTALFSALDALLLRPLPVHEPRRLVEIRPVMGNSSFSMERKTFSHPEFRIMTEGGGPFSGIAATARATLDFGVGDRTEEVHGEYVSGNYFSLLGVRPALGRFFGPDADRPEGGGAGVVLSHPLWKRWFGGDSAAIGKMVRLNGQTFRVIGVAEEAFTGTSIARAPRLWLPFGIQAAVERRKSELNDPMGFQLSLIGRLKPGVTQAQAEARASALVRQAEGDAMPGMIRATAASLHPLERIPLGMQGSVLRMAMLLGVATLLVLLIAGTNVAGMLLVRGSVRQHEIAIREAIGAGRTRIVRQLLTEGLLLWLLGGAAGVLLAAWLIDLLLAFRWPSTVPLEVALNGRVLAFALLVSLVTGAGFGLLPALSASRPALLPMLKDGRGRRRGPIRLQNALVVGQVAMSVLLLVGAGLFLCALSTALQTEIGFDPDRVEVASIRLAREGFSDAQGRAFYSALMQRVRTVPGVESASLTSNVPLGPGGELVHLSVEGFESPEGAGGEFIGAATVSEDFFHTLRIPIVRGRGFTDADREGAPLVAVVSQALAEHYWPGENPIGKRFRRDFGSDDILNRTTSRAGPTTIEVIGVVPDVRSTSLREEPKPFLYLPSAQRNRPDMELLFRTAGNDAAVAAAVRSAVHQLDPRLPVLISEPLTHLIADSLLPQRIGATLTSLFGLVGLLLAGVGLYGVLAYMAAQRTREIGIRVALGAGAGGVLRLILGRGARLVLAGLAVGLAASLALTRFIASFLYGVSTADPLALAAAMLLLAAVALVASYLPARRATRVDPMEALRAE